MPREPPLSDSTNFIYLSPPNMNQSFINDLVEFDRKLEAQVNNWNVISEAIFGKQPKSACCHAEVSTYQLKDVCTCCLERCELEK